MQTEGPTLETMLRRLTECPAEFCQTCATTKGGVQVAAIIADHFRANDAAILTAERAAWLANLRSRAQKPTRLPTRWWGLLGVATWLLHDDYFLSRSELAILGWRWLTDDALQQLADLVRPEQCVSDPDRREELTRLCLSAHGLRPLGESEIQAADRLGTLDSVGRKRILQATAAANRRAREVREAMARKRALESASRYGE